MAGNVLREEVFSRRRCGEAPAGASGSREQGHCEIAGWSGRVWGRAPVCPCPPRFAEENLRTLCDPVRSFASLKIVMVVVHFLDHHLQKQGVFDRGLQDFGPPPSI